MSTESIKELEIPNKVSKIKISPKVVLGEVFTKLQSELGVDSYTIKHDVIEIDFGEAITVSEKAKRLIEAFMLINPQCAILFY